MIVQKYTSHISYDRTVQDMEFIGFQHLLLCIDMTKRDFHYLYRYEKPGDSFLDELKSSKHQIIKQEDIPLAVDESKFNDLNFALYETTDGGIAVFDGLIAIGNQQGLHLVARRDIQATRLPPLDILEEFELSELEGDKPYLRCSIPANTATASLAMRMEELDYRIFDDIYRCPGEGDDEDARLEGIRIYLDNLRGYFDTIGALKHYEEMLHIEDEDTEKYAPPVREFIRYLGVNMDLFNDDGTPKAAEK